MKIKPLNISSEYRERIKKAWLKKVHIPSLFECWEWQGIIRNGYGSMSVPGTKNSGWAHRISYALFVEPIAENMHIDHRCRNPLCVNPTHLKQVTPHENYNSQTRRKLREKQFTLHFVPATLFHRNHAHER